MAVIYILKIKSKRTLPYCVYGYSSVDGFLVSKENMVLCRWESDDKNVALSKGLIKVELPPQKV